MKKLFGIYQSVAGLEVFGNGRFVRQILEESMMNLAERLMREDPETLSQEVLTTLEAVDIPAHKVSRKEKPAIGFSVRD